MAILFWLLKSGKIKKEINIMTKKSFHPKKLSDYSDICHLRDTLHILHEIDWEIDLINDSLQNDNHTKTTTLNRLERKDELETVLGTVFSLLKPYGEKFR